MLKPNRILKPIVSFFASMAGYAATFAGYAKVHAEAEAAEQRLTDLLASGVSFLGCAFDGGPLDYAGRIYKVAGHECLVRQFDYVDEQGTVHVVVRSDGYQRIMAREGNDNHIERMSLKAEMDRLIKAALRTYITRSYTERLESPVELMLG